MKGIERNLRRRGFVEFSLWKVALEGKFQREGEDKKREGEGREGCLLCSALQCSLAGHGPGERQTAGEQEKKVKVATNHLGK